MFKARVRHTGTLSYDLNSDVLYHRSKEKMYYNRNGNEKVNDYQFYLHMYVVKYATIQNINFAKNLIYNIMYLKICPPAPIFCLASDTIKVVFKTVFRLSKY